MGNEKELAIEKLKNEEKGLSGSVKLLCRLIIDKIPNDEQLAKGILDENKSMKTCFDHICKWAKTKAEKGANCCCIEDGLVVGEAIHYFTDVKEIKKAASVKVESKASTNTVNVAQNKSNENKKVATTVVTKDKLEIEEFSLF